MIQYDKNIDNLLCFLSNIFNLTKNRKNYHTHHDYHDLCHNYNNIYLCQRPESRKSLSQFHQSRNHHLWTCNQLQVQKVVNCKFKKLLNKSLFNSNHTCCEFSKNLDFFEVEGVSAIVHLHQNISASQCGLVPLDGWVVWWVGG